MDRESRLRGSLHGRASRIDGCHSRNPESNRVRHSSSEYLVLASVRYWAVVVAQDGIATAKTSNHCAARRTVAGRTRDQVGAQAKFPRYGASTWTLRSRHLAGLHGAGGKRHPRDFRSAMRPHSGPGSPKLGISRLETFTALQASRPSRNGISFARYAQKKSRPCARNTAHN